MQYYNVFLSHNSKDKPVVRELKRRLLKEKLTVWLDEDELQPGVPWQQTLEIGIRASESIAVLVGGDGVGPWENEEMQAALTLAVESKRPVIPVLLPGATTAPSLPMFLGNRTWVRLGSDLDDDAIARLVWGITGAKPAANTDASAEDVTGATSGTRVLCRLSCREKGTDSLHGRPLAFLNRFLLSKFPETEFRLSHQDPAYNALGRPADMKSGGEMMLTAFEHGEVVILEVSGKLEIMASSFVKTALENLDGYSDDPVATRERIFGLIDELNNRLYDPDLDEVDGSPISQRATESSLVEQENRAVAVINDRLHDVSVPALPLIAKFFECRVQIAFELADSGVYVFTIGPENEYGLDARIIDLDIPVGTRITITAAGERAGQASVAIRNVFQNLWQCDRWIRSRAADWDSPGVISDLLAYAREMERNSDAAYEYVQNPFITSLVAQSVVINPSGRNFSKRDALEQLAKAHSEAYNLDISDIVSRVERVESEQIIIPRPGFAIAHAAMDCSPRISISMGVYPDGVSWSKEHEPVKLATMVLCARDTYRTWADYRRKFAILFRSVRNLQQNLLRSRTPEEFIRTLRAAESSLAAPR